jgi:hypothetical protein
LYFFVNSIPNPHPTPQEVPLPMQDEYGDGMEENEWVHEGSIGCCKVNACTNFYAFKWLLRKHLDQTHGLHMQLARSRHPSTHFGGLKQQYHTSIKVFILNNLHAKQKWNEKNVFNRIKEKAKFK